MYRDNLFRELIIDNFAGTAPTAIKAKADSKG